MTTEIACFISPHGFGHATRTIAVLEMLQQLRPDLHPHIFSTVPESLIRQTLHCFTYHHVLVDVGLVQNSALEEDIDATLVKLDAFLPFSPTLTDQLAALCANCSFVLCDIAPLGIAVAKRAGIPSILLENFTWDWIYEAYLDKFPQLAVHIQYLKGEFARADYHIQTEPLCNTGTRDLLCGPIFRQKRDGCADIRRALSCSTKKTVLVTLGGLPHQLPNWMDMELYSDYFFIFSGQKATKRLAKNILYLDSESSIYHPDLVDAVDLVVCKAGYSTVAECCQAGSRIIAVGRPDFAETKVLQKYIQEVLGGDSINTENFLSGQWLSLIPTILKKEASSPFRENGAQAAAHFLVPLLGSTAVINDP